MRRLPIESGAQGVFGGRAHCSGDCAGVDITKPFGNLVVDIGAGTTDVAVISVGGVVISGSLKVAGATFNQAIIHYVREAQPFYWRRCCGEYQNKNSGRPVRRRIQEPWRSREGASSQDFPRWRPSLQTKSGSFKTLPGRLLELVHSILEKTPPELAVIWTEELCLREAERCCTGTGIAPSSREQA